MKIADPFLRGLGASCAWVDLKGYPPSTGPLQGLDYKSFQLSFALGEGGKKLIEIPKYQSWTGPLSSPVWRFSQQLDGVGMGVEHNCAAPWRG